MSYQEPSELELAILDRMQMGLPAVGPLTQADQEGVDRYEQYMDKLEEEYQAARAAGGRTVCPQCGKRSVKHSTVCTYGRPGVEGSDYSDYGKCENCGHKELAG